MSQTSTELEHRLLQEIAREYRQRGYRVLEQPGRADLPDFLAAFQPDMIALGNDDNVVIEVKSRAEIATDDSLLLLTAAIENASGWQLDLVVTNPDDALVVGDQALILSPSEIRARLATVRLLLSRREDEAALLLAWSAIEASLRFLAEKNGIRTTTAQTIFLMKQLYSLGLLGKDDYDLLQTALRERNSIAHSYTSSHPRTTLPDKLLDKATAFLDAATRSLAS